MPLTVSRITAAKAQPKPYKLADGGGLYLLVTPQASKLWRLDYRYEGRRRTLAIGKYPEVKLIDARDQRDQARKALRQGLDPGAVSGTKRRAVDPTPHKTFAQLAERWFQARKRRWCPGYATRIWNRIVRSPAMLSP